MTRHRPTNFAVEVGLDADRAIVAVRGDVDMCTAPTMGALLRGLVDQDHRSVVLDFADLAFMDGAGLRVIDDISARLAASQRELAVRSLPLMARWMLGITGVSQVVRLESGPAVPPPDPDGENGHGRSAVAAGADDLAADIVRMESTQADTAVLDAALGLVTVLASATVDGADGVSVTLSRRGRMTTVASSDETIRRMDEHQYDTGQGPCLSAAAEGHWFHVESLADEDRWPAFVPRAVEDGIASILSTPLMAADGPLGALNIYSNTGGAFGPHQQELAALFAAQASGILVGAGAGVPDAPLRARMTEALSARETIAQAQGVYMARRQIPPAEAAAVLHRSARTGQVTVLAEAMKVVSSTHTRGNPTDRGPDGA